MKETKKTKKTESLFVQWLKKIFTAQTITILIGLIGLAGSYYAYKTYKDSRPSLLSIEYDHSARINDKRKPIDVKDITYFCNLSWTNCRSVVLGNREYGGFYGQPRIINRTKKSITNLLCKVTVNHWDLNFKTEDISPDYEIVRNDERFSTLELKYKYTTLAPWAAIPHPIRYMHLPDSIPFSSEDFKFVDFLYEISYDGSEKPISFCVRYFMFFDYDKNEHPLSITNKSKEWFLEKIYNSRNEGLDPSNCRFAIVDGVNDIEIKLPENCSREEFQEFKKDFIEEINK